MIFVLSFLLSWLSGLLIILLVAFASYESFGLVDITSFAVLTFAGDVIVIPLLYLSTLRQLRKKIIGRKQFIWFPFILVLTANLPAYFIIWLGINRFYGQSEAVLFFLSFVTTAVVFGLSWARKNNSFQKKM